MGVEQLSKIPGRRQQPAKIALGYDGMVNIGNRRIVHEFAYRVNLMNENGHITGFWYDDRGDNAIDNYTVIN